MFKTRFQKGLSLTAMIAVGAFGAQDEKTNELTFKANVQKATINGTVKPLCRDFINTEINCHVDKNVTADLRVNGPGGKMNVIIDPKCCKLYCYNDRTRTCKLEMLKPIGEGKIVSYGGDKGFDKDLQACAIKLDLELSGIGLAEWVQLAMRIPVPDAKEKVLGRSYDVQLCQLTENEQNILGANKKGTLRLESVGGTYKITIEADTTSDIKEFDFTKQKEHQCYSVRRESDRLFHNLFCKTFKTGRWPNKTKRNIRLRITTSDPYVHLSIVNAIHGEDAMHECDMKECAQNQDGHNSERRRLSHRLQNH